MNIGDKFQQERDRHMKYPRNWTMKRCLQTLESFADDPIQSTDIREAGKQAMRMKAVLEMMLMFYTPGRWEYRERWQELQSNAGVESPEELATTKVLCDTIRNVLGIDT